MSSNTKSDSRNNKALSKKKELQMKILTEMNAILHTLSSIHSVLNEIENEISNSDEDGAGTDSERVVQELNRWRNFAQKAQEDVVSKYGGRHNDNIGKNEVN